MKNKIVYDGRTFEATDIKSGQIHLAASLPSMKLEPNTFTVVVKSEDKSLTEFTRNTPLYYYYRERLVCISYVQTVDRIGPNKYKFYGTSAIGLLIEGQHYGGIYTGQTAREVIADICGTVPFAVKSNLEGIKLYGWLPIASPRDNLAQVLFAIGAALKTDLDGVLRIEGLWDGISGTVTRNDMYTEAAAEYDGKVTQVIVSEHQYVPWTEEKQLFEGTAQAGDIITFDEPMHSLKADGFTVLASGANWARVSAGSGVLSGKTYIHNTRQITKDVWPAKEPNVKTVKEATLVSLVNSLACAQRMADYYRCRERVDAAVVYRGELPGDRLATYHPFDKTGVAACLESADITLSNTLKAQEKSLVGFVPKQVEQMVTYDKMEVLTKSGTWTVPEGVTNVRVVVIGGGFGGSSGHNGKPNKPSTGTRVSWTGHQTAGSGSIKYNNPGKEISATEGGDGGDPGTPGQGGKIYSETVEVVPGQQFAVVIGRGGSGGTGDNVAGEAGTATTFGSLSSDSGSSSPAGYLEEISGKTYGAPGGPGIKGQHGVDGHGEVVYNDFWGDYTLMKETYTIPPPLVFNGVSYVAGQAQSREAGYSSSSGSANSSTGEISYGWNRGLGGGAAAGVNGPSSTINGRGGATGAKPVKPKTASNPGNGGDAGHGGGGAGGAGGRGQYVRIRSDYGSGSPATPAVASQTDGGPGGDGGNGAPGCVILYYGVQEEVASGQLVDKNNHMVLDRLRRRIIM